MMNMNKVEVGLAVAVFGVVIFVGCLVYYEMNNEIANNPDIKDIGGPPAITDLRVLVGVVVGLAIPIFIILKLGPKDDKKQP